MEDKKIHFLTLTSFVGITKTTHPPQTVSFLKKRDGDRFIKVKLILGAYLVCYNF